VTYGAAEPVWLTVVHLVYLVALAVGGYIAARRIFVRRLGA
jgi:lipooligosaccharide transport system permease protein